MDGIDRQLEAAILIRGELVYAQRFSPNLISMKTTRSSILIILSLVCVSLLPNAKAVMPPPDGGYPGGNTAEGLKRAFQSDHRGRTNTAVGYFSLDNNRTASFNTAVGAGALFANTRKSKHSDPRSGTREQH